MRHTVAVEKSQESSGFESVGAILPMVFDDLLRRWDGARAERHALEPGEDTPFDEKRSRALDAAIIREEGIVSRLAEFLPEADLDGRSEQ